MQNVNDWSVWWSYIYSADLFDLKVNVRVEGQSQSPALSSFRLQLSQQADSSKHLGFSFPMPVSSATTVGRRIFVKFAATSVRVL